MTACSIDGCRKPKLARGWCAAHYQQWRIKGDPLHRRVLKKEQPCTFEGCTKRRKARGLCEMHVQRLYKHGDPSITHRAPYGAGTISLKGYRIVTAIGHPNAQKPKGKIPEHRLVMSQKLGRPLLPNENVHHINGNKLDNRPENLELWVRTQPCGQRVTDLLSWAREIIERYG